MLSGCREHNLQDVTLRLPLGLFTVVTGVSGSGKSTLVNDTLCRALAAAPLRRQAAAGRASSASRGSSTIDKVIEVDQSPIGRTPRSNPATYSGAFDGIRELFAPGARGARARLRAGPLLLQREGRALRGVPGRRLAARRDALPARSLRHLRGVRRPALRPRDARDPLQGQEHRRRARDDRRGGGGLPRERAERAPAARDAARGRPRLRAPRPAGDDALRRRGAAHRSSRASSRGARPGRTLYLLDEPTTGPPLRRRRAAAARAPAARRRSATPWS